MRKRVAITVKEETYQDLLRLRIRMSYATWDQVLEELIRSYKTPSSPR